MLDIGLAPGNFLISPPSMADSRFTQSVVVLTHHRDTSLGFCINKPVKHSLREIVSELDIDISFDPTVFWGGPVNQSTVWMLHDNSWTHPAIIAIDENWNMLSHITMFDNFNDSYKPEYFKIVMGCSSWAPEQLESEMRGDPPWSQNHSWLILRSPPLSLLTEIDSADLWKVSTDLCLKQSVSQLMT